MAIITIGGKIGAGKSTVAPLIAGALGYEMINMGDIFRKMARERGLSLEDFYKRLAEDPELERSVDKMQATLIKEKDDAVAQGHIAFFFAKQSGKPAINIYLDVSRETAAKRKMNEGDYRGKTLEEVVRIHEEREKVERERYLTLYGIENHLDPSLYDIICDTANLTPDEVVAFLLEKIKEFAR